VSLYRLPDMCLALPKFLPAAQSHKKNVPIAGLSKRQLCISSLTSRWLYAENEEKVFNIPRNMTLFTKRIVIRIL